MAMSLVPEDLPLEPEIAATRTPPDGNCLFNAVSLALVGDETQMSLLRLLVAVELLLNCEFYILHPRSTLFSSADHQEDKLFSLCLTRESDKVKSTPTRAKRMQFGRKLWLQLKVKSGADFFTFLRCRLLVPGPFSLCIQIVKLGYGPSCTLKYVPVRFRAWYPLNRSLCCGLETGT